MSVKVILGLQNGDEGKGRVVDDLCHTTEAPIIVRFQGGANAGHTIYDENSNKSVVHLLPSGVLNPNAVNIITRAVVVDPLQLVKEIEEFNVKPNTLIVSSYAPVVMTWHIDEDIAKYQRRLGTTAKGIGPALRDFIARDGITLGIWLNHFATPEQKELLTPYIGEAENFLRDMVSYGRNVILEGCQGYSLDVWGAEYPNVTSSCTTIGAVFYSTRLSPKDVNEVIGVAKVYETKVGTGTFDELQNETLVNKYREIGKEYGATTGRPRKIGWLNLPMLKEAVLVNGIDTLIITKTDVPVLVGVLKIKTDQGYEDVDLWGDGNIENLHKLLLKIKEYTGVSKIGYTYGENRGCIKLI